MAWLYEVYHYQYLRFQRHLRDLRTKGPINLLKEILDYAKDIVYLRFDCCIVEMIPPRTVRFPEPKIAYTVIELKEPIDLSHLIKDLSSENVKHRLARGEYGFAAIYDKRAIGTLWLTNKSTYFPSFEFRAVAEDNWIHLEPSTGYVYRGAVEKSFHGQGIFHALLNAVVVKAQELSIKKLVSTHGYDNIAARKSALRQGWKVSALVSLKRVCMITIRDTFLIEKIFPVQE